MGFQGVILDVDGTLVLSNDAHAQAWVDAFAKYDYQINFEEVRQMIGIGGDQIIPKFAPGLSDAEGKGKEIITYRTQLIVDKFAPKVSPASGARELVEKMQNEGLHLIIASSAKAEELGVLLKAAQVDDLLNQDEATTSSDAKNSKPAPDIVEVALSKLNLQPENVVMLGDTPYDVESANKAGVEVIAFRCGGFDDSLLENAIAIYDHPADLLQNYDNSPLSKV
ncbi:HAD family hydrolase [Calothrix sp. PCC 6303]|uniref:HAD family hydrolase n=1 Tax=Calothrix sp. PCC 6303 TaxID=1170562 RepID=UPI0002A02C65|nr:HAD family hydrolase [Calothrix sp. PCC 6303]AFZ02857.1 HAD-superfamily hydrolase, subfamily IA, variant 3 [Calothrix sp. PCC 6303]